MGSIWTCAFVLCFVIIECQGNTLLRRWTYTDDDGSEVEVIPAEILHKRGHSEGLERHARCRCYCRRTWEREYTCCECVDGTCFPGSATVNLESGDVIKIQNLKVGDRVLTADLDGTIKATSMLGFLDRRGDVISIYYKIQTASGAALALSGSHLLYTTSNSSGQLIPRYASLVRTGDYVMTQLGEETIITPVINVTLEGMKGAYVPLTETGTILVDDVLTSCYASFPHDVAHVAMAPLRWFPSVTHLTPDDGVHPYVGFMKTLGRIVLPETWLFSAQTKKKPVSADEEYLSMMVHDQSLHGAGIGHSEL